MNVKVTGPKYTNTLKLIYNMNTNNQNGNDLRKSLKRHLSKGDLIELVLSISAPIACNPEMSPEAKIDEIQANLFRSIPGYVYVPQESFKPDYHHYTKELLSNGNTK